MKLNNEGWGLNTLLLCIGIMLFALLVAVVNIYKLTGKGETQTITESTVTEETNKISKSNYYAEINTKIETATRKYILDNSSIIEQDGTYTVEFMTLEQNNYLESIKDYETNEDCNGYSLIKVTNGMYQIEITLNCPTYTMD